MKDRSCGSFPAPDRLRRPCDRGRCGSSEACLQGRWRACDAVAPREAEPVHHVRHQLLEAGVLNASDTFGALEILGRRIAAFLTLAGVIDEKLRHFAERTAFLAIVDDDAESPALARARAFF